jgi:hypothetical protein
MIGSPSRSRIHASARKRRLGLLALLPALALLLMAALSRAGEERRQWQDVAGAPAAARSLMSAHPDEALWAGNATQDSELLGGLLSDWVDEDKSREAAAAAAKAAAARRKRPELPAQGGGMTRWQQLAQRHHGSRWRQFVQRQQQLAEEAGDVLCAVRAPALCLYDATVGRCGPSVGCGTAALLENASFSHLQGMRGMAWPASTAPWQLRQLLLLLLLQPGLGWQPRSWAGVVS